jgi:hypothetical protein
MKRPLLLALAALAGCGAPEHSPKAPPIPVGKADAACAYQCADYDYDPGECWEGWQCDAAGQCLSYVGTPDAPDSCPPVCTPATCQPGQCGPVDDGCGGKLDCGGCSGADSCGGGGVPNQCGCTPNTGTQDQAQALFDARIAADPSIGTPSGGATQVGDLWIEVLKGGWVVNGGAQDHAWLVANFHDGRAYFVHDGFLCFYEGSASTPACQVSQPMSSQFGAPVEDEHADGVANHVAFQQFERGHMIWLQNPWSGQTLSDPDRPVCAP